MLTVVVAGLVSGAVLLLATVGFELLRRVEGFLNIAHPQLIVLGGFSAYGFNVLVGLHWIVSCVLAIIVTTLVGVVTARAIFWPMRQRPHYIPMIASVGLAFFLHAMIELFTGFGVKTLDVPLQKTISVGGVAVAGADQIAVIGTAAVAVVALHFWLSKSYSGRALRAMANNQALAQIRGVNTTYLQYLTWAVASALAALAGTLIALTARIYPELGWDQVLVISAAAIIGGLGSIYGVMLAAVLVGLTSSLATLAIPSEYTQMVVFAAIALVVFVRPEGLFTGPKERVA
ncbi:integral membrane protein NatD [Mycolicibacterium mageritense DSM 44476 = CIP 104973]|uniref:Branched-chain amino acid ABC transporter permease n=1 Tax=Mycolicibacterium mageritense TaxID=53462 RepID=A0ABM7HP85_MYCME|nr:branched-chain amino acid ABC transporter permease [Mycolicibacterium mageritense]MCC9184481.1 branched-chain amino acid ABC transporter permease [Mycolicibacterium mageritense]BBX32343.1 branched-chain amino acid ABC transporter permease [Mycolicibacterium mageritense]GJJ20705.1 branched-chain amino acid ABC transporter permease [Mycolicibacterium mageritense]CDO23115.1 integral membrane protein NatD [Mycolicibacterium mageritense DSM 44476 = CIP 104973]